VAGRQARAGAGVYDASKWAVNAFSESLRQEVTARGVRVSLGELGAVATELTDHITNPASREGVEKMYNSIRAIQAEDIARIIVNVITQPAHLAIRDPCSPRPGRVVATATCRSTPLAQLTGTRRQ